MKLDSIQMTNFRSFDDCTVEFDSYTALVGANGSGKSTILCALNIFFRDVENSSTNVSELDEQDFHNRQIDKPIRISVTFSALTDAEQNTFKEYYRHGKLTISAIATWDPERRLASVKQYGQRLGIEQFRSFFELFNDGASAAQLGTEYEHLQQAYPTLPKASTKEARRAALLEYEAQHENECVLIQSEDQFYGFSKGANRLSQHIQWVYVPAVKDASKEGVEAKNTALGKILSRTVRSKVKFDAEITKLREDTLDKYRNILKSQQGALDDISKSLTSRLGAWAHPEATARLAWTEELNKSVQVSEPFAKLFAGEGTFEGELVRFGHGLQRSYLLALLQELVASEDMDAPLLILGCEEPELYQHPPQARHLSGVLQTLSEGNAQVIVTTHSPYFVTGSYFENVRLIRHNRTAKKSNISRTTFNSMAEILSTVSGKKITPVKAQAARLQQALQPHLNEMFFANKLIFVEGLEDVAYLTTHLILTNNWYDFRRFGCHIIACNGKNNIPDAVAIAKLLGIPTFVVFDADGDNTNEKYRPMHEAENVTLLKLLGGDYANPFPEKTTWADNFVQWQTNFGTELKNETDSSAWDTAYGKATESLGKPDGKYGKNSIHIGYHLQELHDNDVTPESLSRLTDRVLQFAAL